MRIAIVTDSHLTARTDAFNRNWAAVRAWVGASRPDLVVHLGDITADGASDIGELADAADACRALDAPVRFLPGNHDVGDNPPAPGAAVKQPLDRERLADYRDRFGPDYWSLTCAGWQLVGLNAQLFATGIPDEAIQFDWLAETLQGGRGRLGLMLHKPLFENAPDEDRPHQRYVPAEARRRLLELAAGRDLRFVLCGHTHQYRRLHVDGVEHVWAPSCAFVIPDAAQERIGDKRVGVMQLTLGDGGHAFELLTPDGVQQHSIADHPGVYGR